MFHKLPALMKKFNAIKAGLSIHNNYTYEHGQIPLIQRLP